MINSKYELWLEKASGDADLIEELISIKGNTEAISDRFYKDLEFGTAGLRGEIGAGTNRMNIYTVGKATQGLAEYVLSVNKDNGSVAIAYDSRIKSDVFARTAACILAANGVKVYLYNELMPTPMLSFAVRYFKCDAGIVITASHNPAQYNGYKAYGPDGCQLGIEASNYVLSIMNKVDAFEGVKTTDFDKAVNDGLIEFIGQEVIESYLDAVQACSVNKNIDFSSLNIVYTPLNGTGNKPVRSILDRIGLKNIQIVKEQELPDGNFPTAPYPNPEIKQAFELALQYGEKNNADLLLATDPDCDRVGIAVKHDGEYRLMTGNDVGALLLDYVLKYRTANGTLPKDPIAVKTIVTTELCQSIADSYNCQLINVLTGFKFIGEQIGLLEEKGEENRYVFGFEESYGYLGGSYVRDKDAVIGSMLICEMVGFYKSMGKTLIDVLESLYEQHGYYICAQQSFSFAGESGMNKIKGILDGKRTNPPTEIAGEKVVSIKDYQTSVFTDCITGETSVLTLPKSNVIIYTLADKSTFIIRPSGTEPKVKFYISAVADTKEECSVKLEKLKEVCKQYANN